MLSIVCRVDDCKYNDRMGSCSRDEILLSHAETSELICQDYEERDWRSYEHFRGQKTKTGKLS